MSQFKTLLTFISEELRWQEELLKLLTKERVSVMKLNQNESDKLSASKQALLEKAIGAAISREEVVREILGVKDPKAQVKISAAIAKCPLGTLKRELQLKINTLKNVAKEVKELNTHNAELIGQALGVLTSTLAIVRSTPGSELSTYGVKGKLKGGVLDPAFQQRRALFTEA